MVLAGLFREIPFVNANRLRGLVLLLIQVAQPRELVNRLVVHGDRLFVRDNGFLGIAGLSLAMCEHGEHRSVPRVELHRFLEHLDGLGVEVLLDVQGAQLGVRLGVGFGRGDGAAQRRDEFGGILR